MKIRLTLVFLVAAVLASPAKGSSDAARWFLTPGKHVDCEMGSRRHGLHPPTYVFCLAYKGGSPERTALAVQMKPSGKLSVCHGCLSNAPSPTPTLKVGHSISLGPFRCTSLRRGVRCIVVKLGHGFVLSLRGLKRF